jgi:hypothetical protein
MSQVFTSLQFVGVILQVALLLLLVLHGFRRYGLLMVYSIAQLVTALAEVAVSRRLGDRAAPFVNLYWTDEILLDLLLFLMVIGLTNRALEDSPLRAQIRKLLGVAIAVAVIAPFAVYHQRKLFSTAWFNGVSQWLNFGAAILNLGLWTALLSNKKRDPQLTTVSIGLGLAVTGAAMSYGLRQFFHRANHMRDVANLVGILTHVLGVAVWCWAFRPNFRRQAVKESPSLLRLPDTDP